MSVLMIGASEREKIAKIIAWAKAHPIPLSVLQTGVVDHTPVLQLKDRRGREHFVRPPSQHILFPGNYHAAFSCEEQADGFCSHLSISVEGRKRKGMMPHPAAVEMIAQEFGVKFPADRMWMEEFEPGEFAINLLSLYQPRAEGHA
jgi:hypothetical protein